MTSGKGTLSLYVAMSLDGYIARGDGSIDWLTRFDNVGADFGYAEYYRSIDALLMGRKTYEVAAGFGPWPHADRPCYVMSRAVAEFPHAVARKGSMAEIVGGLKEQHRKIWLVGGGEVTAQALAGKCLDEIIVTVIPILLGGGVRLFARGEADLTSMETRAYPQGLTQIHYAVRYPD